MPNSLRARDEMTFKQMIKHNKSRMYSLMESIKTTVQQDKQSTYLGIHDSGVDNNRCSQHIIGEQGVMIQIWILQILTSREFSLLWRKKIVFNGQAHGHAMDSIWNCFGCQLTQECALFL